MFMFGMMLLLKLLELDSKKQQNKKEDKTKDLSSKQETKIIEDEEGLITMPKVITDTVYEKIGNQIVEKEITTSITPLDNKQVKITQNTEIISVRKA